MTEAAVQMLSGRLDQVQAGLTPIAADVAEVRTAVAVLVERSERADRDMAALRAEVDALGDRVAELEARRWPLPVIGGLAGVVSAVAAVIVLFAGP